MDLDQDVFSKLIRINSHDRNLNLNESNAKFTINVPSYSREFSQILACQVVSAHIPHVFYNLPQGQNTFTFIIDATSTTASITIPEGQYSVDQFLSEFEAQMDTVLLATYGATSTTIDDKTFKVEITFPTNITFQTKDNWIATKLGFGFLGESYSGTNIFESPGAIALTGPSVIYIKSDQLSAGSSDFDRTGDINTICSVSLAGTDFGQVASYQASDGNGSIIKYTNVKSITSIDIELVDKFGFPLNLGASHEVNLTVKLYFIL